MAQFIVLGHIHESCTSCRYWHGSQELVHCWVIFTILARIGSKLPVIVGSNSRVHDIFRVTSYVTYKAVLPKTLSSDIIRLFTHPNNSWHHVGSRGGFHLLAWDLANNCRAKQQPTGFGSTDTIPFFYCPFTISTSQIWIQSPSRKDHWGLPCGARGLGFYGGRMRVR